MVSQGVDWKTTKIMVFYSAKLNPAQQNYPVHEIEMLVGVETMLCHADILQGTKFKWLTDHKGLMHLLNQKNLSGCQARWLEKISAFNFEVVYIAGSENVVVDALSHLHMNDSPGTIGMCAEYTQHDVLDDDTSEVSSQLMELPVLAGMEAKIATRCGTCVRHLTEKATAAKEPVMDSITQNPEQQKEGEYVPNTITTPNPPSTIPENDQVEADTNLERQNTVWMEQETLGVDIWSELQGKYTEDLFFRAILDKPKDFRNFEHKGNLIYLKENDKHVLCIPKVLVKGRNAQEILISEAHSMLAHLGVNKTLDYMCDHVWWKDMVSNVKAYCETCHICKTSKPNNQKPYGLLNLLSVLTYPWESIGINFIGPLPESGNRDGTYDSLTVVICLLTSMVHLIPSRINYNASQVAKLMFENIYKIHGLHSLKRYLLH